jgi:hypothetical protein
MTHQTAETTERLMDLERTVEALNGQLRHMRWELQRAKADSLRERFLKNLINPSPSRAFMSAVCNRRARPNIKVASHGGPRA